MLHSTHILYQRQKFVWDRWIIQGTLRAICLLGYISVSTREIFLQIHIWHMTHIRHKRCKFAWIRWTINDSLREEQCTFRAIFQFLLVGFFWKFIGKTSRSFATNIVWVSLCIDARWPPYHRHNKVKSFAATIRQHHVGFHVYCNLNHYSIQTLTKEVNISLLR